ncbi:PREDICTED: zinc finger protein 526-like [Gekko japonicus]|uniref:Zinc finger protein 526-like n=1 Tax=Gekko japonicus TaxID=146911 RepID=A0ABM1JR89_GEKJA|nr:PREDICTED: zinc finger protein 526-like [Gekko japonicus]
MDNWMVESVVKLRLTFGDPFYVLKAHAQGIKTAERTPPTFSVCACAARVLWVDGTGLPLPKSGGTGVPTMQEEEDSETTSVSSGDSGPPTPSANGYPGPQSKESHGAVGEPVDEGGEIGHDRLSSSQAPSPEWHECPECGRGFGTSRALKVHRSYHVGRKRPHSGSSSSKPPTLTLSGNPESREGRTAPPPSWGGAFHYICAECGLGFASPSSLEAHRCEHSWRRSPPAPPRNKPPPAPAPAPRAANGEHDADGADGPYHCTECPGEFGLVSELHEHYMRHARGEL